MTTEQFVDKLMLLYMLKKLSLIMREVSREMNKFDGIVKAHGLELTGAAKMVDDWVENLREHEI